MSVYAAAPPGYGLSLRGMTPKQADAAMLDIASEVVQIMSESAYVDVVAAVREAVMRTGYRLDDVLRSVNYGAGLDLFLSADIDEQLRAVG